LASSIPSRDQWVRLANSLLHTKRNVDPSSSSESIAPVFKGYVEKYITSGKKHKKFICLYANGNITWGEDETCANNNAETIMDLDTTLNAAKSFKIEGEALSRFLTIETTGKTLHILAPSAQLCDGWIEAIQSVLREKEDLAEEEADGDPSREFGFDHSGSHRFSSTTSYRSMSFGLSPPRPSQNNAYRPPRAGYI